MKTLSARKALELLAEVVAEHGGGFIYSKVCQVDGGMSCVYVQQDEDGNDCPSCLVGHAMLRWGIPLDFLTKFNSVGAESLSMAINRDASLAFEVTNTAIDVLMEAQTAQDGGDTWGTALARAVLAYARLEESGHA